jgi:DNA ligase-1
MEFLNMKIIKSSENLVSENKQGNYKYWQAHIVQDGDKFYTQTSWYQTSKDGTPTKLQYSTPYYAAPTNVGRSNERDSEAQAIFEFDAMVKKQMDRGFYLEGRKPVAKPMPMLAHKFKDHTNKVTFPVFVQPKLNGMRMLFDGVSGWSRGNKEVIPEVIQHLQMDTCGAILDGELMLPNNVLLQETMSAIKKFRADISPNLLYHVYDIVDSSLSYTERYEKIKSLSVNSPVNVKLVPTILCNSEADVYKHHNQFIADGYEGTMIRSTEMVYEIGKRSYSLLKLKDFVDQEYKIVDIVDGEGSDKGLAIFILDTGTGKTFNCRPEGTTDNRRELYNNRESLINQYMTVRYQELSRDGVPIFPVGVGIRDIGDFS